MDCVIISAFDEVKYYVFKCLTFLGALVCCLLAYPFVNMCGQFLFARGKCCGWQLVRCSLSRTSFFVHFANDNLTKISSIPLIHITIDSLHAFDFRKGIISKMARIIEYYSLGWEFIKEEKKVNKKLTMLSTKKRFKLF